MKSLLGRLVPKRFRKKKTTIPLVRLHGVIQAESGRFRSSLNLESVSEILEEAFENKKAPAVALSINSPGGSPVQSRAIFAKIRSLALKHDKKVLVFVEDVAASGGYMIALAGDEIIADPTSIVGSIGVISGGFGFPELIRKLGIERRVYTAGANKSVLDPFLPEKESDVEHLKSLQLDVHKVFIDMVKERRAGKLADNDTLFTGLFWSGEKGLELGLVDAIGDIESQLKLRYGDDVKMEPVEASKGFVARLISGRHGRSRPEISSAVGEGLARGAFDIAEERLWWSRFGL